MKKVMALVLACLLALLPCASLAAPARDMGLMDAPVSEQMQHMLNLIFSAAMIEDVMALDAKQQVPAAYQETLFALFNYVEGGEGSIVLSAEDVKHLYALFFAAGQADAALENGMQGDLGRFDEMPLAGAYVHESKLGENGTLEVSMDLYTLWGYFSTPVLWVPEGDLTWWAGARAVLAADESAAYGYTLLSYEIGVPYMDGLTADWQLVENVEMEYSVRLPSVLGLADDQADRMIFQSADGEAQVNITCTPGMDYDHALAAFAQAHPDAVVTRNPELFMFTAVGEGHYIICVADEVLPYVYTLELTFLQECQQEYTLYGDLIRNSLAVWGLNNG